MVIENENLSSYSSEIHNSFSTTMRKPIQKLMTTLNDKRNYVLHIRNLQTYTRLGLKLINAHRAISFKQHDWLKPYIIFNNEMRSRSSSTFDRDFYKLMNNSFYGKTL